MTTLFSEANLGSKQLKNLLQKAPINSKSMGDYDSNSYLMLKFPFKKKSD